jgi:hypothetical protein
VARGEQGSRERGAGLAIAAAFGVLCLVVLFGVISTTRACDSGSSRPPPYTIDAPEPFPGAFAAAQRLGTAGCRELGPGLTPASHRVHLARELEDRGYVADDEWSPPTPMPTEVQAGGCGRIAAVADGGFVTAALEGSARHEPPCNGSRAAFATCGVAPMSLEGQGDVLHRTYLVPGLTAADVEASDFDVETLLAHAEAEVALTNLGYEASEELVLEDLGSVAHGHYHTATPPAVPDEGCVLWVGVASGLGNATVSWNGDPSAGYMPANVSFDAAQGRATFALFACGADSGAVRAVAQASVIAPRAGPARVVYRAYAPPARPTPAASATPVSPTIASARKVDATHAALPTTVPFVRPDAD